MFYETPCRNFQGAEIEDFVILDVRQYSVSAYDSNFCFDIRRVTNADYILIYLD